MKIDAQTGIIYNQWVSPSSKAVFLLVHGLGAHSGRWEFLADFFLRNGISSYAIELRGFGGTKDLKGHIVSFNRYFSDIKRLHSIIRTENSGKKIFLVGESLGALICFLFAASWPDLFDGLICISPAFKSRLKFSILTYIKIFFSLLYKPKKQFKVSFDSSMVTRDIEYQRIMDLDNREHRLATSKLLINIAIAQFQAGSLKSEFRMPILFLIAGEDKIVYSETSIKIFENLAVQNKKIIQYFDMYHALSIDMGREKVFKDILEWVKERL